MSWQIRHQGSPRQVSNLTLEQVIEGLQDGLWEPTDEVMGPGDRRWTAIENHAKLADLAQDYEPMATVRVEEEERLDMNPLIDVCLVLLVFFILTTTYQTLEKVLRMPESRPDSPGGIRTVTADQVKEFMIFVQARKSDGKLVIKVEDRVVDEANLERALLDFVRRQRKTELLIDATGLTWGEMVRIIDAAAGARINKVHFKAGTAPVAK